MRSDAGAVGRAGPAPGSVVAGRYRVRSLLGRGGMGTVWLAEHLTVGRDVAIKVLSQLWAGNDEVRHRFVAEARAASRIDHPGVVEILDAGELADGRPFLVMEFLGGRSLLAEVRAGPLPIVRAVQIAHAIADVLVAAHAVGIVHRDLKSENVMLVPSVDASGQAADACVKLLDFGIAAAVRDHPHARLTLPGVVMGTPGYMAPEQGRGAAATPSFDVYALGSVLFEMLGGVTPFEGEPMAVLVAKASVPARSIARVRADVPAPLVALVDACLAIDPRDRPRDMIEVRTRLAKLFAPVAAATTRRVPGLVHLRSRWHRLAFAAALVAALPTSDVTAARSEVTVAPASAPANELAASGFLAVVPHEASGAPTEPTARVSSARAPPKRRAPRVDEQACASVRARAYDARESHDWPTVLRLVHDRRCWGAMIARDRLRVKALLELHRFGECLRVRADTRDSQIRKSMDLCRLRLARGR